ncbi:hypothetical protein [Streptoalloteichus hindustanus]|uniref:hypothetical protein n=1 Tax=Streptoalloteichus hindustanus TaxID=2017 RepID=UPI000A06E970|nr:hypothetical protein [Streptoalloteichus hindustanus]
MLPLLAGALAGAVVIALFHLAPGPSFRTIHREQSTVDSSGGGDERELAQRPMPSLPPEAARPQPLSTARGPEPHVLPAATETGRWVPGEFTASTEGALAQLVVLWETALHGADPALVERAYRHLAMPGAPDPATTGVHRTVVALRVHAGAPATGPVPDLRAQYRVTHGLVKGSTDRGRYVVVCVLGEMSVTYQAGAARGGLGDCQAMRWAGVGWRVAPGPLPAPAPHAWPGSDACLAAGYREVRRA